MLSNCNAKPDTNVNHAIAKQHICCNIKKWQAWGESPLAPRGLHRRTLTAAKNSNKI